MKELDNELRNCKEEFKEFERQDVKYREDDKHMKQKIKKLDDKILKVYNAYNPCRVRYLFNISQHCSLTGLLKDQ